MSDGSSNEVPDFVAEASITEEDVGPQGVIDPMAALAMQAWAIMFTFTANTAFFFETKEYFQREGIYSGDRAAFNRAFFGLDWIQFGGNAVAIWLLYTYQDWFILTMWLANTVVESIMLFLAAKLNDVLPSGESEFTLVQVSALNALAASVATTITQYNSDRPYNLKIMLPALGVLVLGDIVGLIVYYLTRVDVDCSVYTLS